MHEKKEVKEYPQQQDHEIVIETGKYFRKQRFERNIINLTKEEKSDADTRVAVQRRS